MNTGILTNPTNLKPKVLSLIAVFGLTTLAAQAATVTLTPYTGTGDWPSSPDLETVNAFAVANAQSSVASSATFEQSFTLGSAITVQSIYLTIQDYDPSTTYTIRFYQMGGSGANSGTLADWQISNGSFTGTQVGSTLSSVSFTNEPVSAITGNNVLKIDLAPQEQVALPAGQYFIAITDLTGTATKAFAWKLANNSSVNYYAGGRYFDGSIKAQQSYRDYGLALVAAPVVAVGKYWAVGDGSWDIGTTANWTNSVLGGGLLNFSNGDYVVFEETLSGTSPITVTLNTNVSPAAVTNDSSKNYTITGTGGIGGTTALTKSGPGTLTLSTANSFTGKTTVNAGTVSISAASGLGAVPGSTVADQLKLDGGTLEITSDVSFDAKRGLTIGSGGGTINVFPARTLTYNYVIAGGALTKNGAGNLKLDYGNADHTYSSLVLNDGAVIMGKSSALGAGSVLVNGGRIGNNSANVTRVIANTLVLNGNLALGVTNTDGLFNFTGPWVLSNATRTITVDSDKGGTINGVIGETGGSYGLTKDGSGPLLLNNANTYSGTTTVSAGTLGGTGSISGPLTVGASGTVAPGASIGTFTVGGAAIVDGTIVAEITNGPSSDKIVFNGSVALNGTLTLANLGTLVASSTYDLFDFNGGAPSGSFATLNVPGGLSHWDTSALYTAGEITFTGNTAPVASNFNLGAVQGSTASAIVVGKYATDADSDAVTVTSVTQGTNGTVTFTGTGVIYSNTVAASEDHFTYTVSDGITTATGTVTVLITAPNAGFNKLSGPTDVGGGQYQLNYLGIPGQNYALDETSSLTPPVTWTPLVTNTAAGNGAISFTVTPSNPSGFFRTRHVP